MDYDAERDCYTCHNGKTLEKTGEKVTRTRSGYVKTANIYQCTECDGCPHREKCCSGPKCFLQS